MYAANRGFLNNYTDTPSISFITFVKLGIEKGFNSEERTNLSEYIRKSDDITFYRHYHGPLYFYFLYFYHRILKDDEFSIRMASTVFLIVGAFLVFFSIKSLIINHRSSLGPLIGSGLFMFSSTIVRTAVTITPHIVFLITALATLFFISKYLSDGNLRHSYLAVIMMGISFTAIEYALILLAVFIISVFIFKYRGYKGSGSNVVNIRVALKWCLTFIFTIFIVWPGALLKLTIIKNYIFFTYYTIVRGAEYGSDPFFILWMNRIAESPVEYALVILCTVGIFIKLIRGLNISAYIPYLIYMVLIFLTTFRNTSSAPTYISSLLGVSCTIVGLYMNDFIFSSENSYIKKIAAVLSIFAVCFSIFKFYSFGKADNELALKNTLHFIDKKKLTEDNTFIDRTLLPTINYYYHSRNFNTFDDDFDKIDDIVLRKNYKHILYKGKNIKEFEKKIKKNLDFKKIKIGKNIYHYEIVH
jgi:hypothetical protein